jgi:hypothetical protein
MSKKITTISKEEKAKRIAVQKIFNHTHDTFEENISNSAENAVNFCADSLQEDIDKYGKFFSKSNLKRLNDVIRNIDTALNDHEVDDSTPKEFTGEIYDILGDEIGYELQYQSTPTRNR